MSKFSTISERRKETALLQAEASACALGLANVLFVGRVFLQSACIQRLSVAAVRDCGRLACPPPQKFERGGMLHLPLKPLLLLRFVTNWPSFLSSEIPFCLSTISIIPFLSVGLCVGKVLFFRWDISCFSPGGQSKLFCKLWLADWL